MNAAEQRSRNSRKPGIAADRLANAARLGALERNLGVVIKRHRDPGSSQVRESDNPFTKDEERRKDETVIVERGF